jgi:hypothetical protein
MGKFFVRVYNVYTGEITELSFFDDNEKAKKGFNELAMEKSKRNGQPFFRMWKDSKSVVWGDYGSYEKFVQMGESH